MMRKLAFFAIIIIALTSVILSQELFELKSVQSKIMLAYELNDASLMDTAIADLQKFILNNGSNPYNLSKAHLLMGDAHFYRGQYTLALESYDKALQYTGRDDQDYPYAIYSKCYTLYHIASETQQSNRSSILNQALTTLEGLVSFAGYQQDYYLLKGMIQKANGDYLGASASLDLITDSDTIGFASYYKGLIFFEQGNYPSAIMAFERARQFGQNPELMAASIYQTIRAMMNLQNYREALPFSEELVKNYSTTRYRDEIFMLHVELLYRTGEYQNAAKYITYIMEGAKTTKELMDAYDAMAWLAYKTGDYNTALENWNKAISAGAQEYPQETFEMAKRAIEVLRNTGDSAKMVSYLNQMKATFPTQSTPLDLESAKVYISLGRYSEAEVLLQRVLSSGLLYQEANFAMAQLYQKTGDLKKAQDFIDRVIRSGNQSQVYNAYAFQGDLYLQMGDYDKAKLAYDNAMKNASDAERSQAILNLGVVALNAKDYTTAQKQFETLKSEISKDLSAALDASFYLAETYLARNLPSNALKEYDWILQNDVSKKYLKTVTLKKYNVMLETNQDPLEIVRQIDTVLGTAYDPSLEAELRYLKGEAYLKKGDLIAAQDAIRPINFEALSVGSKGGYLYIRGKYYASQGNEGEMRASFEQLIDQYPQSPKTPWAIQDYALYYYNKSDFNTAKNLFFKLITTYPDFSKNDTAYFYVGLCYERSGERDKALKIYQDLVAKYPSSTRVTEAKNRIAALQ
jgi:tetratricopeptide (TPR) repeat protein